MNRSEQLSVELIKKTFKNRNIIHITTDLWQDEKMSEEDIKCRNLAMEFMMPEEEFRKQVDSGVRHFGLLADHFDVSIAAARYRAYDLGYIKEV